MFDPEGTETIQRRDLGHSLRAMGWKVVESELLTIFKLLDAEERAMKKKQKEQKKKLKKLEKKLKKQRRKLKRKKKN